MFLGVVINARARLCSSPDRTVTKAGVTRTIPTTHARAKITWPTAQTFQGVVPNARVRRNSTLAKLAKKAGTTTCTA